MGFAVYHVEKGKGSGGGQGNHIDRIEGKEHSFKNADPSRLHLNKNYPVPGDRHLKPLKDAIAERIKEGYHHKKKIRSDAVKFNKHILSGSPEDMQKIFSDPKKAEAWINANRKFIEKEFGKDNLVRFSLHMDEKTPHIHAVTVPLTDDGRLSARDVTGDKDAFRDRQDRYAEAMKSFNLERGIRDTGIKHENASDYYKRIEEARKNVEKMNIEPVKGIFGIDKSKTIEKYKEALKSANLALSEAELKNLRLREQGRGYLPKVWEAEEKAKRSAKKGIKLHDELKDFKFKANMILDSPKRLRERADRLDQENDQKRDRGVSR
jgi:hypothetical protein